MSKSPNFTTMDIDRKIGRRIRSERQKRGLTQERLGEIVDVSYQQIQKYETGQNRVSASRLWLIAEAMDIPCETFFQEVARATSAVARNAGM